MLSVALSILCRSADFQPVSAKMSGLYVGLEVRTSDGKDHLFLVDSGSDDSYVSSSAVAETERKKDRTTVHIDVGPTQVAAIAFVAPPDKIPASIGGLQTEGVLGLNLLQRLQLEIDYDSEEVQARCGSALPGAGPGYVPYLMDRDTARLFAVTTELRGKSYRLCVDTGATALVLDSAKVSLDGLQPLPPSKIHTFGGTAESQRYLIDSMKLGERETPWMVAYAQRWTESDPDDGAIGTAQFGGSKVILDFPGSCLYVSKSDAIGDAASRILGLPVKIDAGNLSFRENLKGIFRSSSGAKIVALRSFKAESILSALKARGAEARKTLVDAFTAMRAPGLVTTERDGQRQLLPVQVDD
ncbi:MAG TPA: aspartyl protease family protein [Fimbriimonadaceae bacterium]|nr:aspartyl protease family protein [Fimbriimonadaceae bacterium]